MPGISDAELKRRLEAHKYHCPPITESTKSILVKKLNQLDQQSHQQKSNTKAKLFEYSSAEEDTNSTPNLRRRKNVSLQRKPKNYSNGKGQASQISNQTETKRPANGRHKSTLVQLSDEEEEEEDEDNEDDEDGSNKTSSSSESELEEEEISDEMTNVAQQTSFSFDSSPLERSNSNGGRGGRSPRFTNSTPITPRSTASYLNNGQSSNVKPPAMLFPPNSPLRRAVAKNKEAFGSLGNFWTPKLGFHLKL